MRKKKTEAVKEVEREIERDRHDQEGSPDQ